ncbi:aconitase X catalytic domain-containing protein [Candidatus Micrarchaeota archaeon]|nr:aconitase X catalytic domain-containing protein [Candidatus Micrarchaeota archaeon]
MYLDNEEEKMLDGEFGPAVQKAMEILVALGKIYGAERMIRVESVQVAGVSYKTMGDAGLEFIEEFAEMGAKVRVPTFINPAGMDRIRWREMGVPEEFAEKQIRLMDAYESMGINPTYTCAPYHIGIRPKLGEHVAWSESNAVSFANSVLGARTNREGGPSALAAAITGRTPEYGLHLDENRAATVLVKVNADVSTRFMYGALGALVGKMVKGKIPAFEGLKTPDEIKMKYLGAAMAASGSVALYYVKGGTPEWKLDEDYETVEINGDMISETIETMNSIDNPEVITIGCPHASLEEIEEIAGLMEDGRMKKVWVFTARAIFEKAREKGLIKKIEDAGGKVFADTCMVVAPLYEIGIRRTGVDSGKAAKYLPSFNKQKIKYGSVEELLEG